MKRTGIRSVAMVALMAFVVVSCGQKPGVHQEDQFVIGAPGQDGLVPDDGTGDGGTDGPPIVAPTDGGAPTNGTQDGGGGGDTGGSGPQPAGDRTGIGEDTIVIGLHAPLSGAAPIEGKAFEKGKDLYWKWLEEAEGRKVFGTHDVEVIFEDDRYTPSTAVQKCNDMSKQAFLLIGGAGTDQINACANFADPRQIPYLSPGVQEAGLSNRQSYFAVSMTYAQQMPLLVQLLKRENSSQNFAAKGGAPGTLTIGHVRPNTPNFDDADNALREEVKKQGWEYKAYTVVKEGNSQEAQQVAQRMQQDNVDVAVPITAPVFTIQLAINTGSNNYFPQYAGVGITNNVNQMINQACNRDQFEGALFFSPWPGWKNVMNGEFDPDFRDAAERFAPDVNTRTDGGDLMLALWGIMKTVHNMLEDVGPGVTRQSFIQRIQNFDVALKVFPTLDYGKSHPFGAQDVHTLLGACNDPDGAQWVSHPRYKGLKNKF